MGTLEFRSAELDRAFQLLDEFIRIRQENGTEPDGDYVNVLFMVGNIHKMQGHEEEAQKCWTEAYDVFQDLGLAEGNPQIAEVMGTLVKESTKNKKKRHKNKQKLADTAPTSQTHFSAEIAPAKGSLSQKPSKSVFGRIAGKMKSSGGGGAKGNRL
jgi:outer membrane protein assembly factor BamD (BamD/ComL family)